MKNIVEIKYTEDGWIVNDTPLIESDMMIGGYNIYNGRNHILCMKYEKDGESVTARVFTNGRFTLKHKKGDEVISARKRYIPIPIHGNVILICDDDVEKSYAYFREIQEESSK